MGRILGIWKVELCLVVCFVSFARGQESSERFVPYEQNGELTILTSRMPADQFPMGVYLEDLPSSMSLPAPPIDFAKLMRPTFDVAAEWQAESSDVEIASYDARVTVPIYPFFGPPPPFINAGFSYTDVNAPDALDLPSDLYDYSLGFAWMRPINLFSAARA